MSLSKKQKSFRVQTVGCKVNQVDSAALVRDLRDCGLREAGKDEHADVCVVNSCTVTIGADRDVRKKISRARRENPESLIVLTGCLSSEGHSAQEDSDIVVGNEGKPLLARMIMDKLKEDSKTSAAGARQKIYGGRAWNVFGRARAFIKVQDGCNWNCAYCIVPTVRGKSRSREVAEVIEDVRGAAAEGFAEVVLTGIHIGLYGNDLGENRGLADLVHAILNDTDIERLRISSIEPTEVSENLIHIMATRPRLCPHFHIPAQSGDDEILRRMGRPYTRDQFLKITHQIADQVPGVLIGTDLIAGFPGESEEAFQNSLRLVEESPIKHLHVFTYSERPGTRAASMPDQIEPQVRRHRCNRLREVGRKKFNAFKKAQAGKRCKILVIKKVGENCFEGLTRNYLPVLMKGSFEIAREYELLIRGYEEKKNAGILVTGPE